MAEVQSWEIKALFQTFLSLETHCAFLQVKAKEEQPREKLFSHNQSSVILRDLLHKKNPKTVT